ncbi:MAG: tol-pal system YbgF family protein, partial [Phycisphaerae bacterium]
VVSLPAMVYIAGGLLIGNLVPSVTSMGWAPGVSPEDGVFLAKAPGAGRRKQPGRLDTGNRKRKPPAKATGARERARKAIQAGDYSLARTLIRTGQKSKNRNERDAWRIVESEMEYSRKRYAVAGLIAMRIVILHPRSAYHGVALYWAGRSYEGLDRSEKAIELYKSCVRHKTTRGSIRKKAKKRLAALERSVEGR